MIYSTHKFKFVSKAACEAIWPWKNEEGDLLPPFPGDVKFLGTLYDITPTNTFDEYGQEIVISTPREGYHVDLRILQDTAVPEILTSYEVFPLHEKHTFYDLEKVLGLPNIGTLNEQETLL